MNVDGRSSAEVSRLAARASALAIAAALTVLLACGRRAQRHDGPSPTAPDSFRIAMETNKGMVSIMAHRDWAPRGVDRLYDLLGHHYYDNAQFFRALKGFVVQFGIAAEPAVTAEWKSSPIPDDSVRRSNGVGMVSFASSGPNSRTAQIFINLGDNRRLDALGFAPVGEVVEGMNVIQSLYMEYRDDPEQKLAESEGNRYLRRTYALLDWVKTARVVEEWKNGARLVPAEK
ncbi:MAG: hypothetical protein NVS1B4_25340 [Gemmatimonadaceae bacterium]